MKLTKTLVFFSILLGVILYYFISNSNMPGGDKNISKIEKNANVPGEVHLDTVSSFNKEIKLKDSDQNSVAKQKQKNILVEDENFSDKNDNTVPDTALIKENLFAQVNSINTTPVDVKLNADKKSGEEKAKKKNNGLEIENLLLNETVTKIGKDFYDAFYKNWSSPENGDNTVIIIQEKPMPSMGTRITIKVNDYYVFQQVLQPRYEAIKEAAEIGVSRVSSFINNYNQIQKDLQGEDMIGTGIY